MSDRADDVAKATAEFVEAARAAFEQREKLAAQEIRLEAIQRDIGKLHDHADQANERERVARLVLLDVILDAEGVYDQ